MLGFQGSKTPPLPPQLRPWDPVYLGDCWSTRLQAEGTNRNVQVLMFWSVYTSCVHAMRHHFFTRLRKKGLRINDTIGSTGKISNTLLIILVFTVCNKIIAHRLSRYVYFNLFRFKFAFLSRGKNVCTFWSKHPTFQLFDKDERTLYLESKVAQQQQNLHLFKTMLQQKEVYVMEDEVNHSSFYYSTKLCGNRE